MRKIASAAFLLSGALVFSGLMLAAPAQAADTDDSANSEVIQSPEASPSPKGPGLKFHEPKIHLPKPEVSRAPKTPKAKLETKEQGAKRLELEQKYGKAGRLSLPPLVIRPKRNTDEVVGTPGLRVDDSDADSSADNPVSGTASAGSAPAVSNGSSSTNTSVSSPGVGSASAGFIAVNPAAKDSVVTVKTGTAVNPQQNTAIDISNVKLTKKTPADVFIQAAQVGLYAMAAGALFLSLVAASRAIRRK